MKRTTEIFLSISLVLGLVFLSMRPSLTNRTVPVPVPRGSSALAPSALSSIGFPSKVVNYRGSFGETEKKNLGHSLLAASVNSHQDFGASWLRFELSTRLPVVPPSSKNYSVLRI